MKKYFIEINELLSRTILVEAIDEKSAIKIAKGMYKEGEVVLDSQDYLETTIEILEE